MARFIGIRHRIKQTKENEARPTQLTVINGGQVKLFELETETDELDWLKGKFPLAFREPVEGEDVSVFPEHQLKFKKVEGLDGKKVDKLVGVPSDFDGLTAGDLVGMILGGSGDYFAYALSLRGVEIGAEVHRIPAEQLKKFREKRQPVVQLVETPAEEETTDAKPVKGKHKSKKKSDIKNEDSRFLAELVRDSRDLFYKVDSRDRDFIFARESLRFRMDAMKDRIACEQRLRAKTIGRIFCNSNGYYPDGSIEKAFDDIKANDVILQNLESEEARQIKELEKSLEKLEVYQKVFKPIEGMGPLIAARLICQIVDIRRFATAAKLKKYCGVHLNTDGSFPRFRGGESAGFHPMARQGAFLLGDQFNRRPKSVWGQKLLTIKAAYRVTHPEPIKVLNKEEKEVTRFSDGHVHKTALWRSRTKFIEYLFSAWWKLEKQQAEDSKAA